MSDHSDDLVVLKISSSSAEVNVYLTRHELADLAGISESTRWAERASIKAGTVAGTPVWWAVESGLVTIMIGVDDEVWDVAISGVPVGNLLRAIDSAIADD